MCVCVGRWLALAAQNGEAQEQQTPVPHITTLCEDANRIASYYHHLHIKLHAGSSVPAAVPAEAAPYLSPTSILSHTIPIHPLACSDHVKIRVRVSHSAAMHVPKNQANPGSPIQVDGQGNSAWPSRKVTMPSGSGRAGGHTRTCCPSPNAPKQKASLGTISMLAAYRGRRQFHPLLHNLTRRASHSVSHWAIVLL